MVERRKHYWNSRWGRLARMDILVYEDAGTWMVEAREGRSGWQEPLVRAVQRGQCAGPRS